MQSLLQRGIWTIWGNMGKVKSCVKYGGGTNRHSVIPPISGLKTVKLRYLLGNKLHVNLNTCTNMYWEQLGHESSKIR